MREMRERKKKDDEDTLKFRLQHDWYNQKETNPTISRNVTNINPNRSPLSSKNKR